MHQSNVGISMNILFNVGISMKENYLIIINLWKKMRFKKYILNINHRAKPRVWCLNDAQKGSPKVHLPFNSLFLREIKIHPFFLFIYLLLLDDESYRSPNLGNDHGFIINEYSSTRSFGKPKTKPWELMLKVDNIIYCWESCSTNNY